MTLNRLTGVGKKSKKIEYYFLIVWCLWIVLPVHSIAELSALAYASVSIYWHLVIYLGARKLTNKGEEKWQIMTER